MPKMMRGQKPTDYLNIRMSCRLRVVPIFLRDSRVSETIIIIIITRIFIQDNLSVLIKRTVIKRVL